MIMRALWPHVLALQAAMAASAGDAPRVVPSCRIWAATAYLEAAASSMPWRCVEPNGRVHWLMPKDELARVSPRAEVRIEISGAGSLDNPAELHSVRPIDSRHAEACAFSAECSAPSRLGKLNVLVKRTARRASQRAATNAKAHA